MRAALVQMDLAWEDWPANHAIAAGHLKRAADAGADLAILPEMFATGFSMNAEKTAQAPGGPTERWLLGMARGLGMHLLAGVAETGTPLPLNSALLVSSEGEVKRYHKIHPFSYAGEEKVFGGGSRVVTWEVAGARLTPLVCYDLRFPEPFRLAASETDVYAVIANWPDRRRAHWQTLLRARAVENLAYVLGVNRVGDGGGAHHAGDSAAVSPWGETLASAAEIETVLIVDVDPAEVAASRARFSALADRRPDAYRR
ncbi:MAG TPA: nitrilase-related carbon-nitrogen hydrolase [Thermoanaerobaculia bacterium]|nr:nitrilase-related carbon-nitrogen hydrolase [Thermoanaerobaculia bacterium]HQR67344.1 nitrilase-related carbon-nitrogen hydrolase [Thermoanaerobaculia bacterium]